MQKTNRHWFWTFLSYFRLSFTEICEFVCIFSAGLTIVALFEKTLTFICICLFIWSRSSISFQPMNAPFFESEDAKVKTKPKKFHSKLPVNLNHNNLIISIVSFFFYCSTYSCLISISVYTKWKTTFYVHTFSQIESMCFVCVIFLVHFVRAIISVSSATSIHQIIYGFYLWHCD